MSKYLYGASVQGIQGFIFETNKLREIAGASELIDQICTNEFKNHIENKGVDFHEKAKLIMAAGNIKYIFDNAKDCQVVVNDFAKNITTKAPGITISQAVVSFDSEEPSKNDIDKLEDRLKTQRVRAVKQHGLGWMISEHSRATGNSGVMWKNGVVIDKSQYVKLGTASEARNNLMEKLVGDYRREDRYYPFEMDHLVDGKQQQWIAVVHADGNSLGKLIQKMVKTIEKEGKSVKGGFSLFSKQLNMATIQAAKHAFDEVVKPSYEKTLVDSNNNRLRLPIRPVVIGGDDLTVIIKGDIAVDFTNSYLNAFKNKTSKLFEGLVSEYGLSDFKDGLTACAGIAYVKPSYPFHYAIDLAEGLCSYSKKVAKEINEVNVPSCLMFHKVQSSFIEDYNTAIERELKAGDVYLNYGPYTTDEMCTELPQLSVLKEQVKQVKRADSPKSNLRQWLSELSVSDETAFQLMERTKTIHGKYIDKFDLNNCIKESVDGEKRTHIYDILTLASIEK